MRLNALCGRTAASPAATTSSRRSGSRSRRRSRSASARRRASRCAAQIMRQDNVPDYGIPGAAWAEEPLAPTTVIAAQPVDSSNFYGSVGYRLRQRRAGQLHRPRRARLQQQRLTLRNQTRYNETHRDRGDHRDPEPCRASMPATQTVTLARQGNERENSDPLEPDEPCVSRFVDRRRAPRVELRHRGRLGRAVCAGAGRARHAATAVSIYEPNPFDPVTGYAPARTGASTTGQDEHGRRLRVRHRRPRRRDGSSAAGFALGALRRRVPRPPTRPAPSRRTCGGSDGLISGKAGVLYRLTRRGNVYASVRHRR